MSTPEPVELTKSDLLGHLGTVTVISSLHHGRQDIMAITGATLLDLNPSQRSLVIDPLTRRREPSGASKTFEASEG